MKSIVVDIYNSSNLSHNMNNKHQKESLTFSTRLIKETLNNRYCNVSPEVVSGPLSLNVLNIKL